MLNVKDIVQKQWEEIDRWHKHIMIDENSFPTKFIQENNHWNFLLWHEEDIARIPDIEPEKMLAVKRNIDRYNQSRNNSIEEIDEWLEISWENDAHQSNPDWLAIQRRSDEIVADMIDGVVADPYERLVPRWLNRGELADRAEEFRSKRGDDA